MEVEIEAKFADINPDDLREKLRAAQATLVHEDILMRRKNFDYPDRQLEKIGGWIRIRDEGNQVTLSYKQVNDRSLHGTQEISLVVSDFETILILAS